MSDQISQTERPRIAVEGRRIGTETGPCTVVAIRTPDGCEMYPHGVPTFALFLARDAAARLGEFLRGPA